MTHNDIITMQEQYTRYKTILLSIEQYFISTKMRTSNWNISFITV